MGRRDYDWWDLLEELPWWVSVCVATALFLLLMFVVPAIHWGDMFMKAIAPIAPSYAWFAWLLLIPGAFSAYASFRKRRQFDAQTSLESIRELPWWRFEELVAEGYRRQGYFVEENPGRGADGGTDVHITRGGRHYLVQCKNWKAKKVGVKVVREMLGLVTAHRAAGAVIMTTGSFTQEAEAFARNQPVELMDGSQVLKFVLAARGPSPKRARVVAASTSALAAEPSAPVCPRCGSPLKIRRARNGSHAGQEFWGCTAYPRCKYLQNIAGTAADKSVR